MTNPISFLFDWLLGLTRPGADPNDVRAFVANPTQAASQAMGTAVTQAQLPRPRRRSSPLRRFTAPIRFRHCSTRSPTTVA